MCMAARTALRFSRVQTDMGITKEEIEKRRTQLQAEHQQAVATVHAINGAIQDCEFWLSVLEESDKAVIHGGNSHDD